MQFETQSQLPLLPYRPERRYVHMSMGRRARGRLLYWGTSLLRSSIVFRHGRVWLERFEIIGGVLFAIGFLGLFVWQVVEKELGEKMLTLEFWWTSPHLLTLLVWCSCVSWCFAIYRSIARKREPVLVEAYLQAEADTQDAVMDGGGAWEETLRSTARSRRIDISQSYTLETLNIVEHAVTLGYKYGAEDVDVWHMFSALLATDKVLGVFVRLGISQKKIQAIVADKCGKKERTDKGGDIVLSDDVQQIVFSAYEYAYTARQEYVHLTEVLLATVLQSEEIQELMYDLKVDANKLLNVIEWLRIRERLASQYQSFRKAASRRSKHGIDRAMTAVATPYLNSFSQDLTLAAKFGRLEPCVAREKEIDEIFRVIEGGRQSVVLVGERGVGKMSIVQGIAQRMVEEKVPERLRDKRLVQMSTSSLLAGTTISGAQERIINIMNEVARAKNIIFFIDGIDDLVGSGGDGAVQGLDVSETLAEFLSSGSFLSLATTTQNGYNQHIVNSAVGQVLAKVDVAEMTDNQAIQVLESKVGGTEYKHNVFFTYDALEQSVKLSKKFLHDQNLPESALSIMTETASYVHSTKGKNTLVTGEDIGTVISQKTGIPTSSISEDESTKLLRLEQAMHEQVIGQDEAVSLVANALRRARAEIRSQKRPIANFLFLGPTGVGKTELAKTIANVYFGGEERMTRIDMSEYQDKSGIYRLIGQPGKQGTGILTEAVRQNPFSLILLDEMEKADPDVLNLFLQVFDDGRLTDSIGRVIDFTNTIIIATSNAGTAYVQQQISAGIELEKIRQALMHGELQQYYRPEFLNRFDGIVLFRSLTKDETMQIASLMLGRVKKDLEAKGIFFRVEQSALVALADVGYDPEFGARPMRRAIQDMVENQLAELFLGGQLERRDTVVLGDGAKVTVEKNT
jgi:ATP-dependent Clp protease ATP-binding subunit ClpC